MTLKKFLKLLTDDGRYYAELVDNLAEIYYLNDSKPSVLIEFDKQVFHINFRSDLIPNVVAQICSDIFKTSVNAVVGPVFAFSQDKGIVYGEEALGIYYLGIYMALNSMDTKDSDLSRDAIFVVKDPLSVCLASKPVTKKINKYKKMWDE